MSAAPITAIVPAAGRSRRMGEPKLLIAIEGKPLIARVVWALREGGASPVIVVAPPDDTPEGPRIAAAARQAGATVLAPATRPAEMRQSVELGLQACPRDPAPAAVVLTPADAPGLSAETVARVIERWRSVPESIVVPFVSGRRAHPIVLPWSLASQIPALPPDLGVNALIEAHVRRVVELDLPYPELALELNTPDDLQRWRTAFEAPGRIERFVLTVRLFAIARERAGRPEIQVELTEPANVGDFRQALAYQHPALAALAEHVLVAVDSEYAGNAVRVHESSQVALIPPVSGG